MNGASQRQLNSSKKPTTKEDKNPYGIRKRNGKYYCLYIYSKEGVKNQSHIWGDTKLEVTAKVEKLKYDLEK